MKLPSQVTIYEVGPRDGLQNEPTILPTEAKIAFIERAIDAGIKHIEAVSFVNPKKVPQMADAEAVMAGVPRDRGAVYCGLVLNQRGFDRAVAAGCDEILFVTSSTDRTAVRAAWLIGTSDARTLAIEVLIAGAVVAGVSWILRAVTR